MLLVAMTKACVVAEDLFALIAWEFDRFGAGGG
jgi:hypothetical protein